MKTAGWITLFYGILVFIGGIIGHVKAASTLSFVMGSAFGILLIMSAVGMFKDRLFPAYFGIILTLVLDAFFTFRWLYTFQFFPAGLFTILSTVVLVAIVLLIRNHLIHQRKS